MKHTVRLSCWGWGWGLSEVNKSLHCTWGSEVQANVIDFSEMYTLSVKSDQTTIRGLMGQITWGFDCYKVTNIYSEEH